MTKNKNDFLEKNKKIELLGSTATLLFPETCSLKFKDLSTLEVTFSKERYPVLGINIQPFIIITLCGVGGRFLRGNKIQGVFYG